MIALEATARQSRRLVDSCQTGYPIQCKTADAIPKENPVITKEGMSKKTMG
jgi:hypothetical protein